MRLCTHRCCGKRRRKGQANQNEQQVLFNHAPEGILSLCASTNPFAKAKRCYHRKMVV